jgi:mRNA guanylyltransferase
VMGGAVPDIPGVLAPPDVCHRLKQEVSYLLGRNQLSFPGSQPVSFARRHIEQDLMQEDYFVCEKSDGLRCLMYLSSENGNERVYLITRKEEYFFVPDLHLPRKEDLGSHHHGTLLDGELVISKNPDGAEELQYLIFDCLALTGKVLVNRTLDKRLGFVREGLYAPYKQLVARYPDDCKVFPFKISVKHMERSYGLEKVFNEIVPALRHVSDGLVFTSRISEYVYGTDEKILKWKPPEENTVDFRLDLQFRTYTDPDLPPADASYLDYDSKPTCVLNVWRGQNEYRPFDELFLTDEEWEKLKALHEPLDERIVETFKDDQGRWRYLRFRDDKKDGNHVSTVEKVLESIGDAVSKEELLKACPMIGDSWKKRNSMVVPQPNHHDEAKRSISADSGPVKRVKVGEPQ